MADNLTEKLTREVNQMARAQGVSLVGFADVERLAELPRAVVLIVRHSSAVLADPTDMPNLAYLEEIGTINDRLEAIETRLAAFLRDHGFSVRADPPTGYGINDDTLTAPFSHKMAATRAGLGWIGKCALLVTPQYGPGLRLTSILTDAPLAPGEPIVESRCGDCSMCASICPAGAVRGTHWRAGRPRRDFYDAFACRDVCFATAQIFGDQYRGCGACMAICPWLPGD